MPPLEPGLPDLTLRVVKHEPCVGSHDGEDGPPRTQHDRFLNEVLTVDRLSLDHEVPLSATTGWRPLEDHVEGRPGGNAERGQTARHDITGALGGRGQIVLNRRERGIGKTDACPGIGG